MTTGSLSVIIPAYCEAENILDTLQNVTGALAGLPLEYEILVIDDASTDGTGEVVTANLHRFPHAQLLVNPHNRGFGGTYRRGVQEARLQNVVMVHGDNAWGAETLHEFFRHVGDADVIIGYTREMLKSRTWTRTVVSKTFTWMLNRITRRRLKYYNGLQIHPSAVLKGMTIESSGFGFQPEVLVKSLRQTKTFIEVPMDLIERKKGESKAFRFKNVVDVAKTMKLLRRLERP
jgi:glycosyltransferase involved in cell wall biosynthesis